MRLFLIQVGGLGLGYLLQVLLAQWMGAEAYGAYTYVFAWASTLALLTALGLPSAALRFIPTYRTQADWPRLRGLIRGTTALVLGLSTGLALVSTVLLLLLKPASLVLLLLGTWCLPLLTLLKLQVEFLRSAQRLIWAYAPSLLARPLLMGLGAFLLVQTGRALTAPLILGLAAAVLIGLLAVQALALRHTFLHTLPPATPRYTFRPWLRVALPLLLSTAFIYIVNQADLLMVGLFLNDALVGHYYAASRTVSVVILPLMAVNGVIAPLIASIHLKQGSAGLERLLRRAMPWVVGPSLLTAGALFVFAEPVLRLFGPSFSEAAGALRILAVGYFFSAAAGPVGLLMDLTGHQDESARVYGACALLNILINAAAIPLLGLAGAALATTATLMLRNAWLYWLVVKGLGVRFTIR